MKVSITHISNAHNDWLRSLDFYKSEINVLKGRLTEIAHKNTHPEVMEQVEHFENQFKVQTDNIEQLAHDINRNIAITGKEAHNAKAGFVDGELLVQHNNLKTKFMAEEKTVNELRHEFMQFAAKWM